MLHILLVILKIIGILLLAVIFLLLAAVLIVLFVPVRYHIKASRGTEGTWVWGKASWLLHLITLTGCWRQDSNEIQLKIFGRSRNASDLPKSFRTGRGKTNADLTDEGEKLEVGEELGEVSADEEDNHDAQSSKEKASDLEKDAGKVQDWKPPVKEKSGDGRRLRELLDKFRNLLNKILEIPDRLRTLWKKLKASLRKGQMTWEKISEKVAILRSEQGKNVWKRMRGHGFYLWKHFHPKKVEGELHYGFGDPALTGQATGVFYLLLPLSCEKVRLFPDFENTVCEGTLEIKGHIRIFHLTNIGWKIFRDKEFRNLLKEMKA